MSKEDLLSRRNFLKLAAGSVVFGPPSAGIALWSQEVEQAFTEVDIRTHTLNSSRIHNPYCLVHISDTHFSATSAYKGFIDSKAATNIVSAINATIKNIRKSNPDITLVSVNTGDFIIQSSTLDKLDSFEKGLSALSKIEADQHIAVLGNHDNGYGNEEVVTQMISNAGFTILDAYDYGSTLSFHNDDLQILGTADYTTHPVIYESSAHMKIWQKIFDETTPKIWLTHNAQIIDILGFSKLARKNVLLSLHGHTHGGQVSEREIYRPIVEDLILKKQIGYQSSLINGFYKLEPDNYWTNVNSGLGSVAGDLIHTRGIMPRVDVIKILPGDKNILEWDTQQTYKYR